MGNSFQRTRFCFGSRAFFFVRGDGERNEPSTSLGCCWEDRVGAARDLLHHWADDGRDRGGTGSLKNAGVTNARKCDGVDHSLAQSSGNNR